MRRSLPAEYDLLRRKLFLPPIFQDALETCTRDGQNREALDALTAFSRDFLDAPDRVTYIHGHVGTGKTHLSMALAFSLANRYGGINPNDVAQWWDGYDLKRPFTGIKLRDPERTLCLIVDDFHGLCNTEWELQFLTRQFELQLRQGKSLVLTGTYPLEELRSLIPAMKDGTPHEGRATPAARQTRRKMLDLIQQNAICIELLGESRFGTYGK